MIPALQIAGTQEPLRKSAQRLRWFVRAFEAQVARTSADTGNRFEIDHDRLSQTFVAWLQSFNQQKPEGAYDRPAYVGFAAGLMLRELITAEPLKLAEKSETGDSEDPASFWPEGYVYVAFCLNVRGMVLEKDYQRRQELSKDLKNLRTWWSFKENVGEDPDLAIAFLDHFANEEPSWSTPSVFQRQRIRRITQACFEEIDAPGAES